MDIIIDALYTFLLTIDGVIYDLIRHVYDIFIFLAGLNIFSADDYNDIVKRIYLILGVVMLFVLAYSLLRAVIEPDKFAKGETSFPSLIKNVVISLVVIAFLPTVFQVAFNIQQAVMNNDIIPKIIMGDTYNQNSTISNGGNTIAFNTFYAFFHPNESSEICEGANIQSCANNIKPENAAYNLSDTYDRVQNEGLSFREFASFGPSANAHEISYTILISTLVGAVLLLIILSYCVDLAIRVVKLVLYQVLAPIPVIARALPTKNKIFSSWLKETVSTYLEVFIRIAIMYLGVYLVTLLVSKFPTANSVSSIDFGNLSDAEIFFALAFLILGIILFFLQAPKLIKNIFGFDLSSSNPLKGALGLASATGAGLLTFGRNFSGNLRKEKGLVRSLSSGVAGGVSAATRAAVNSRNIKGVKDMVSTTSKAINAADQAKSKRATYKAKHGGTTLGTIRGHVTDFSNYLTGGVSVEDLDVRIKAAQSVSKANDDFRSSAKRVVDKNANNFSLLEDFDSSKNFTGSDKGKLADLFNQYGYQGQSLAVIKNDVERRKAIIKDRNDDYYLDIARQELMDSIALPEIDARDGRIYLKGTNQEISSQQYNELARRRQDLLSNEDRLNAEITKRAREKSFEEQNSASLLDKMYSQLETYATDNIANAAMSGVSEYKGIQAKDLYDTHQLGLNMQKVVESSGLTFVDPATNKEVVFDENKGTAKYFKDLSSTAKNIASQANMERQAYLEKNKK